MTKVTKVTKVTPRATPHAAPGLEEVPAHAAGKVPGPIAIALMTGRPELAIIALEGYAVRAMGTPFETLARELVDFAVGCVRDVQAERDVFASLALALESARTGIIGALHSVERLEEALAMMQRGADAEQLRETLKSNAERTREKKAARGMDIRTG